ncbi:MAG: hypothetical protein ACI32N_09180 [Bulleidia sp.]
MTWDVNEESFGAPVVLDGSLSVPAQGKNILLEKGNTAFVKAGTGKICLQGCARFVFAGV